MGVMENNKARKVSPKEAHGRPIKSTDGRKLTVMNALKKASGCRKVTMVSEVKADGGVMGYSGNCMNPERHGDPGLWFVPWSDVFVAGGMTPPTEGK